MTDEILYPEKIRLPVWAIAKQSYGYFWKQRVLLTAPMALFFVLQIMAGIGGVLVADLNFSGHAILTLFYGFAVLIVSVAFAVGLHRRILLEEIRTGSSFFHWDRYTRAYLVTWLTLMVLAILAGTVLLSALIISMSTISSLASISDSPLMGFLPMLSLLACVARLGLAFPAASVGDAKPLVLSWKSTSGNWGRMLGMILLTFVPLVIAGTVTSLPQFLHSLSSVVQGTGAAKQVYWTPLTVAALIVNAMVRTITAAVLTTALSLSYESLVKSRK